MEKKKRKAATPKKKKSKPARYWNYRLLAHKNKGPVSGYYIQVHEVHYKNERPVSYTENGASIGTDFDSLSLEPLKALNGIFKRMKEALEKPVLCAGAEFPKRFKHKLK